MHWRTGAAAVVGTGLGASVVPNLFSLFIQPLQASFGWSRGDISLANNAMFISAIVAPFAGRLIDRIGARPLILFGFAMMGVCYALLSQMQGSLRLFYLLFSALVVLGIGTTGLGFSRVISSTFVRSRGFSLAVGRSGLAICATVLPAILYAVISRFGWQGGYILMACLTLCVALPICWLGIERVGPNDHPTSSAASRKLPTLSSLIDRRLLTIAIAATLAYAPLLAITTQLQAIVTDMGVQPASAVWIVGLMGASSVVGLIVTGLLLDRFWAPAIAFLFMIAAASGAVLLLVAGSNVGIAAAGVILLGLGYGAEIDLLGFVIARYFGMGLFGTIYGIALLTIAFGTAASSSAIGLIYDQTGGYSLALTVAAASLVLSGMLYLTLGRYPDQDS